MVNGDDTLSTVTAIDANSMRFEWRGVQLAPARLERARARS